MARSASSGSKNPRLVSRGDVVRVKDTDGLEEVVRGVSIVLHLSNGSDVVYKADEKVEVIEDPDPALREIQNSLEEDQ